MSFFSGLFSIGKAALGFLTGSSIGSTLARAAIAGFALRKLTQSQLSNSVGANENIDEGVRLQVPPASSNKVPVLYGTAHFGPIITDAELSADNQSMYYCMTLAEKTGTLKSTSSASSYVFNDVYWNDQRVVFKSDGITLDYTVDRTGAFDRSASGLVKIYFYAGGRTAGIIPENYSGTVPAADTIMPSWGTSHKMTNLIFAIVQITYNRDKGVTGLGNFTFEVTNSMKDPGDVLYDLFSNDLYGAGIDDADIDLTGLSALTTYSKTSVSFEDETLGSGQVLGDRYQINGVLDTEEYVFTNIEKVCNSAGSWLSYDNYNGKWGVIINKSGSSVASFDDSNIIGDVRIQGTALKDLYNNVKVEFPNRDIRDRADYVNIEIPSGDRNPNELTNVLNISYELINEPVQAQLLGFIELKQSRVDWLVSFETDYSYMNLKAGEIIDITDSRAGWTNKAFRIISITEKQDETNPLSLEILALEYDSNVYSTDDLYRYTRSDDNGIITIASIGTPGTPQVSKIERDSRPRVIIESTSPSGVVEGLEYWYTTDINEPNDNNRSYILLGTKRPAGGGTFSSGQNVVIEIDTLSAAEFYVKTRGFNDITTGPYSNVSGLVDYTPTQTTDGIGPDTGAFDSLGGLATAIGLLSLINSLDGLFGGASGEGSLFGKIFETFEDITGVDIIQNAQDGNLGPGSSPTPVSRTYLTIDELSPLNDETGFDSATANDEQWAITGSASIRFEGGKNPSLIPGSGNFYLYKSDDTLVQTIPIGSCTIDGNVVVIPFSSRQHGTDYYITADEAVVSICSSRPEYSPKISPPGKTYAGWQFNTHRQYSPATPIPILASSASSAGNLTGTVSLELFNGTVTTGTTRISPQSDIKINFGTPISFGSGTITVGSQSVNVSSHNGRVLSIDGNNLIINPTTDFARGSTVNVSIPANAVLGTYLCGSGNNALNFSFTVDAGPRTQSVSRVSNNVNGQFNRPSNQLNNDITVSVLDSNNNVVNKQSSSNGLLTTGGPQ